MIVVKVELWPGGYEQDAKEIARLAAANVSDGRAKSDYVALASADGQEHAHLVEGHVRGAGLWALIEKLAVAAQEAGEELPEEFGRALTHLREDMYARTHPEPVAKPQ